MCHTHADSSAISLSIEGTDPAAMRPRRNITETPRCSGSGGVHFRRDTPRPAVLRRPDARFAFQVQYVKAGALFGSPTGV